VAETIWKQARRRALGETLELVRLDKPARAILTLGVPLVAIAVAYSVLEQFALATLAALGATLVLGLAIFLGKFVTLPARIATEQAQELEELRAAQEQADQIVERRRTMARLLSQAEHIQRECNSVETGERAHAC
jgi:hypothetical protein